MSLTVCSDWTIDVEKNITYFDQARNQKFATGVTKKVSLDESSKTVNMYEHKFNYGTFKPYTSTQFNGYQIDYRVKNPKSGHMVDNHMFVLPIFRRLKGTSDNKREIVFVQTQDDIEIFLGFKEAPVQEVVVEEQSAESVKEEVQEQSTETVQTA
jgi:hypothetical protein